MKHLQKYTFTIASQAAAIAKQAHKENLTLKQSALKNGVTEEQFNQWVRPEQMLGPK